jgi:hypothetical protein
LATKKQTSIIDAARERFRIAHDAWSDTFKDAEKALRFYVDEHWEESDLRQRGIDRPAISINLCRPKVAQVVNSFRANRPGPKVSAVDTTDVAGSEAHEGLCRSTDYTSNAETAYDTAFEYTAACGVGVFGLTFDYASPDSFSMSVRVRRFADPTAVLFDPAAQDPNGADAQWVFVKSKISKSEYERKYGKSEFAKSDFFVDGPDAGDWCTEYDVTVCEYWTVEYDKRVLVEVSDGQSMFADDPKFHQYIQQTPELHALADPATGELDIASVFRTREVDYPYVKQRIINGVEILEEKEFPSTRIPIWMVTGNDCVVEGKRKISGMLQDAITPQMLLNYSESLNLEAMAMAPKPKWVGAEGTFDGYEDDFANANRSHKAYLQYKPTTINGQPAPPPQFVVFEPKSQAMDVAASRASNYMQAVTSLYDSSVGNIDPRAHSGKAIQALQSAGANGSSHISDNFMRALKLRYQTEIEINSQIMSPGQMVRILGADQKQTVQALTQSFFDSKYDCTVSSGPSYASQRDAVKDFVLSLSQSDPQGWGLVRDIGVRLLNLGPLGDQIAKRWELPQFADDNAQAIPPQVQQQMTQLQQLAQSADRDRSIKLSGIHRAKADRSPDRGPDRESEVRAPARIGAPIAQQTAAFNPGRQVAALPRPWPHSKPSLPPSGSTSNRSTSNGCKASRTHMSSLSIALTGLLITSRSNSIWL